MTRADRVGSLPTFPWDRLDSYRDTAGRHPGGLVDMSVGTPVDPTPDTIRRALAEAADAPGYPLTWGTADLREAVVAWFARRRGVAGLDPDGVLPTIGSKEFVAWLPTLLGLGPGDIVGIPPIAYPTYDIGARLAGAEPVPVGGLAALGPLTEWTTPRLLWLNSPANPTGQVLPVDHLRKVVDWAREHRVVVASDECYAEFDWRPDSPGVPSVLDPRVCGGDPTGLIVCYSLSKQSNLAGYRAAFVAGDAALVGRLLEIRRHAGMMVPAPVQRAMLAALEDDAHVEEQRQRYRARREALVPAFEGFGLRLEHSEAGIYLWATAGQDCWETVRLLAEHGLLVAPGEFYGARGARHVRIALTASDDQVADVVARLDGRHLSCPTGLD